MLQVWASRDEVMGAMNYLVVSFDAYNASFGDRRVIVVEVDSRAVYEGTYREPIIDAGTAMLDRIVWVARSALHEHVADLYHTATRPSRPRSAS